MDLDLEFVDPRRAVVDEPPLFAHLFGSLSGHAVEVDRRLGGIDQVAGGHLVGHLGLEFEVARDGRIEACMGALLLAAALQHRAPHGGNIHFAVAAKRRIAALVAAPRILDVQYLAGEGTVEEAVAGAGLDALHVAVCQLETHVGAVAE